MQVKFETAQFHPYIGGSYCKPNQLGHRVLILGESHYRYPNMPKIVAETTRHAFNTGHQTGHFWGGIASKFGAKTAILRTAMWDSVAFYNYVQYFAGDKPRQRPTKEMWTSDVSVSGFKEVLEVLKPNRILVIGKTTWRMMAGGESYFPGNPPIPETRFVLPSEFRKNLSLESEGLAFWYPTTGGEYALAAPIFHPGYPKGFHSKSTRQVVQKLLRNDWGGPARASRVLNNSVMSR